MKNYPSTRREFLKRTGLVIGGLSLGLLGTATTTKASQDPKTETVEIAEEFYKGEKADQYRLLSNYLHGNPDDIFETAQPGEDYIVAVVETAEPGLITGSKFYCTDEKDVARFLRACRKKDKVAGWVCRYQREASYFT